MKRKVLLIAILATIVFTAVTQIPKAVKKTALLEANIEAMTDDEAGGGGPIAMERCFEDKPQGNIGNYFPVCASGTTTYLSTEDLIIGTIYPCSGINTRPGLFTKHGLCYVQVSQ